MGNARGSIYSLSHEEYTPQEEKFWRYTFDEMKYDHLANLQHIFKKTNKKAHYFGHSVAAVTMFTALADPQHRETAEEISSMVEEFHLLAPIIYVVSLSNT